MRTETVRGLIIGLSLLRALEYAQARKVVHRDLDPRNVVTSEGAPRITDYGISEVLDDRHWTPVAGLEPGARSAVAVALAKEDSMANQELHRGAG
jgi:serine/threonine protein kinase